MSDDAEQRAAFRKLLAEDVAKHRSERLAAEANSLNDFNSRTIAERLVLAVMSKRERQLAALEMLTDEGQARGEYD